MKIKINEMFYSLQGEGIRAGTPTFFIRLTGCKAKYLCAKNIKCDTEFESGSEKTLEHIYNWIIKTNKDCKSITWTGGEPTDQLTDEIILFFKEKGFNQAIETSGLNKVPAGIDFISLSPKVAEHIISKNFKQGVDEVRYVRHENQQIPQPSVKAKHKFISPHSDGNELDMKNLKHCIELCLKNPTWKLSLQEHKIWNIL